MGADNWGQCPRCLAKHRKAMTEINEALDKAFNTMVAREYQDLVNKTKKPDEPEHTLRENYEIGVANDGKFYVIYRCRCEVCDFKFSFRKEQVLKV